MNSIEDYEVVHNSRQQDDKAFPQQAAVVTSKSSFASDSSSHVFRAALVTRNGSVKSFEVKCAVQTDFIRCPFYRNVKGGTVQDVENLIAYWKSFRGLEKGYFMIETARCEHQDDVCDKERVEECSCHCDRVAEAVVDRCFREEFIMSKLEEL